MIGRSAPAGGIAALRYAARRSRRGGVSDGNVPRLLEYNRSASSCWPAWAPDALLAADRHRDSLGAGILSGDDELAVVGGAGRPGKIGDDLGPLSPTRR
jgi:hypothetical protein